MKNLTLFALTLFFIMPAFATCQIQNEETVCTLSNFNEQNFSLHQNNTSNSEKINNKLQPLQTKSTMEQKQNSNSKIHSSSNCQFGICKQAPVKHSEALNN